MTRRARFSKQARQDLDDIWLHTARYNPDSADKLLKEIQSRLLMLARFPELGVTREELASALRSSLVDEYLIFYRITKQRIEIVRILQGNRDLKQIFHSEEVELE